MSFVSIITATKNSTLYTQHEERRTLNRYRKWIHVHNIQTINTIYNKYFKKTNINNLISGDHYLIYIYILREISVFELQVYGFQADLERICKKDFW